MVKFIPYSDQKLRVTIYEKSVRTYYISVCDDYARGFTSTFITNIQILITKLGIMVAEVSTKQNISYCIQSLKFLCFDVLEDQRLMAKFKSLGVNEIGNASKHDIAKDVKIDMAQWVATYNYLVNSIVTKYNLPALKLMIIAKTPQSQPIIQHQTPLQRSPQPVSTPKPSQTTTPKSMPQTSIQSSTQMPTGTFDGILRIRATIEDGQGRYTKGVFGKIEMLNFNLKVAIANPNDYKIASVVAEISAGNNKIIKDLPKSSSVTPIDLPAAQFHGIISVTVIVTYRLSLTKTKEIKTFASKFFK